MWVTNARLFVSQAFSGAALFSLFSINIFTHRIKGDFSPLTRVFAVYPQISSLVTTTTYKYMKTPVRFPQLNFFKNKFLKIKTCNVLQVREG